MATEKQGYGRLPAYVALMWLIASFLACFAGLVAITESDVSNTRLLIAVSLAGAGAAAGQASIALVNYIANQRYRREWTIYFLIRPLFGAAIAIVIYVAVRAAFLRSQAPASSLNYYGVLALSLMSGLYSGSILMKLTQLFEYMLAGTSARSGWASRDSLAGEKTKLRQLDRYHGFLIHEQGKLDDSNKTILQIWLQPDRPIKGQESTEIDIGEGKPVRRATFQVDVYSEECDVEPSSGELVAGTEIVSPSRLRFVFACPAGAAPSAFVELSQRGRTVAFVSVGQADA